MLASTALAGATGLPLPASAQGTSIEVAPVDVTARQRRSTPRPSPKPAPAPVVNAAPRPAPRVAVRPAVPRQAPRVRVAAPRQPVPGTRPADAIPQAGPTNAGASDGRAGQENPRGPVRGFVATRTETGTKTNTPRLETPQAISVIGRDQIVATGSRSIGEAIRYSPGVRELFSGADPRFDQYQIRGFNATATGLYLDGLQLLNPPAVNFRLEPFGLERIEVLRGPSSVLYGGSNPGGLINAISKRPPDGPFGLVGVGANSFGNVFTAFDIGGPLARDADALSGEWSYRLTGLGRTGGTQYDFSEDSRGFIAPALTWRPDAATSLTILTSYQQDRTTGVPFLPYQGTITGAPFGFIRTSFVTATPNEGGLYNGVQREQGFAGYQFEHRFDDTFTFRQNFRYSHSDTQLSGLIGFGYASLAQGTLARQQFLSRPIIDLFNVDNQVEARFDTGPLRHTVLLGLDYKRIVQDEKQAGGPALPISILRPIYNQPLPGPLALTLRANTVQDQLGLYVQDQIKLGRFTFVVSGRQDFVDTDARNILTPTLSRTSSDSAFSGRVGLIYTSEFGLAPYVSYSRSFQPLVGLNSATQQPLRPERGEQVEVGVKYQPDGSRSYLGVAAFDLTRQNFLVANPANPLLVQQSGEARSRGLEFEAVASLADGLNLVGAYTVFDLRNTKNLDPTQLGKIPVNTPDRFGSVFLDYTIPDGDYRGLGFGYGMRYTGSAFADAVNAFPVPPYIVSDAVVHLDRGGWRAAVNVYNLFDETFVSNCTSTRQCFYGERRKVLGTLSYRW